MDRLFCVARGCGRPSALFCGDSQKLEAVFNQAYSLKAFLDPSNFKSYDELKKRMEKVLGITDSRGPARAVEQRREEEDDGDDLGNDEPVRAQPRQATRSAPVADDEEDEMDFFKRIAEGK